MYVCMYVCMYIIIYKLFVFLCINPQKIKKIEHIKTLNYGENTIKLPSWRHLCICFVGTLLYTYVHMCVYIYIYNPIYINYTYVYIYIYISGLAFRWFRKILTDLAKICSVS